MVTRIAILGSTGSVGRQTLDVIERYPDRFEVIALAAGQNANELRKQVQRHRPSLVVTGAPCSSFEGIEALPTPEGLIAAATHPDVDLVVFATSGHEAIPATIEAISHRKMIALANKEAIVCAGDIIMPLAKANDVLIRPIDSEHSAVWQSLASGPPDALQRIILTASGGPFRTTPAPELASVTYQQALNHPNWSMGSKITVDSATLVNKGLELIEAHHLFNVPLNQIDTIVHPEQIIHSLVEFKDGNTIAQLGMPDMRLPIQYALTYPDRLQGGAKQLDLASIGSMHFEDVDTDRFPALRLAREAGEAGGTCPTVFSAVDEVAVDAFAHGRIRFTGIPRLIETVLSRHTTEPVTDLAIMTAADQWARREAASLLSEIAER